MGWGVAHGEAYPSLLGLLLGPGSEVQNHGVDGSGAIAALAPGRASVLEERHLLARFERHERYDATRARGPAHGGEGRFISGR